MRLAGKVAMVTGAAAGLGRAVAARFAREGAHVLVADLDEENGSSLCEELQGSGLDAAFVRTDISDEASVRDLVDAATARHRRIDVLYNNAGILLADRDAPAPELSLDTWDHILRVNLRGPFLCAKYVIPHMLRQGAGVIVNVASRTGLFGCAPRLTAYSSSKAALIGLTRVMAAAYAQNNIRINAVIPGTMDTPMNTYLLADDAQRESYRAAVPLGRLGRPADVEGLAVYLASDESAYSTGGLYMCDGGTTAV